MSFDPEPESTAEPQDALDPSTDESAPEDELGDASASKGAGFTNPISQL
jgi:hypothetical protein